MSIRPIAWLRNVWQDVQQVFAPGAGGRSPEVSNSITPSNSTRSEALQEPRSSVFDRLLNKLRGHPNKPFPAWTVGKYRQGQRVQPFHKVYGDQEKVAATPAMRGSAEQEEIILRPGMKPLDLGPVRPLSEPPADNAALSMPHPEGFAHRLAAAYHSSDQGPGMKLVESTPASRDWGYSGRFDARV